MQQFWSQLPGEIDHRMIRDMELHPRDLGRAYAVVEAQDPGLHSGLAEFAAKHEDACRAMVGQYGGVSFRYPDSRTGDIESLYSDLMHPRKDYLMGAIATRRLLIAKAIEDDVLFPRVAGRVLLETGRNITAYYGSDGTNPVEYLNNLRTEHDTSLRAYSEFGRVIRMGPVLRRIGSYEMLGLVGRTIAMGEDPVPIATEGPVFGYVSQEFGGVELPPQRRQIGEL